MIQNSGPLKIQQNGGHLVQFVSEPEIFCIEQMFSLRYTWNNLNPTVEISSKEKCIKNNNMKNLMI